MSNMNEVHLNALNERLGELKKLMNGFMSIVGSLNQGGNGENAKIKLNEAADKADVIKQLLAESDRPGWLNSLASTISNYKSNSYNPQFFVELIPIVSSINLFKWDANLFGSNQGFDFDDLFNRYRAEGNIEKALDEIIQCLRDILELSDENHVSKKLYDDLISLLKTVEKSKNSSRASVESSLWLVWDFFKSVFFFVNPHLKGIEKIVESVEKIGKHIISANSEIEKIDKKVQADVKNKLTGSQLFLTARSYDENASILPPDIPRRIDIKA